MRILQTIFISLTVLALNLALVNGSLFPKLEEGWTFVPTKLGVPVPVNLAKLADMFKGPQLLSFVAEDHTTFELYTLKNPDAPQILKPNDLSTIASSNFNKSLPTRIYIHGWMEYPGLMKGYFNDAYLKKAKKDVNLIAVNWEKSSRTLNYISARNHVEPIGIYVATFVDALVRNGFALLDDINLIGFSLGAHVAGIAGKNIQSGKLPKIVGLDPAAPLFPLNKPNERLDKYDAKYVEIIHTSGTWLGIHEPIGTSSFYPNHGKNQIGCRWDFTGTCSHYRAFKYFAESIYAPISFYSYPCSSFEDMKKSDCNGVGARMGAEPGNYRTAANIYFLTTNDKSFYARGGSRDMD